MQIGEVIRKYRKSKNMTQEEMACRLGISAPAVNKWENGNSLPDITLLAPIARLLGITVDTLLSFEKELTSAEIGAVISEFQMVQKEKPYEEAFRWAEEKLCEYPNCGQLFWQLAVILDAKYVTMDEKSDMIKPEEADKFEKTIEGWYRRALESSEEEVCCRAADALFSFYVRKEQYEKAEECLAYLSDQNPEKKRKQAQLFSKTGRKEKAFLAYEELLFSNGQMARLLVYSLYMLAMEEEDMDKAHFLAEKLGELAQTFDMGEYDEISGKLELAAKEQDKEATVKLMEKMLESVESISAFRTSPLYSHMDFKELSGEFVGQLKKDLKKCFRDEEAFRFLEGNARWIELTEGE